MSLGLELERWVTVHIISCSMRIANALWLCSTRNSFFSSAEVQPGSLFLRERKKIRNKRLLAVVRKKSVVPSIERTNFNSEQLRNFHSKHRLWKVSCNLEGNRCNRCLRRRKRWKRSCYCWCLCAVCLSRWPRPSAGDITWANGGIHTYGRLREEPIRQTIVDPCGRIKNLSHWQERGGWEKCESNSYSYCVFRIRIFFA